jgi:hypothetical protein
VVLANRTRVTDFNLRVFEAMFWQVGPVTRKLSLFLHTFVALGFVVFGPVVVWAGLFG